MSIHIKGPNRYFPSYSKLKDWQSLKQKTYPVLGFLVLRVNFLSHTNRVLKPVPWIIELNSFEATYLLNVSVIARIV